ncbi:hypothetical protein SynBIOSE41_00989 [Synechococcus sp. BIOS-E4-1]|nr:hypothetical protein SynBIOSE41_00989 [Synechococcus sp. BIOS-E4-1]
MAEPWLKWLCVPESESLRESLAIKPSPTQALSGSINQ